MARCAISTSPAPIRTGAPGQIGRGSTHLIKIAVEAAVGKRDHVAVFGTDYPTPDGTCIRDYIHVSDLAAAHVAALERLIARPQENLILNCGYGIGLSVLQVLDAVDRANGAPVRREMGPRRPGDAPELVAGESPPARNARLAPGPRGHRHDRRPRPRVGAQARRPRPFVLTWQPALSRATAGFHEPSDNEILENEAGARP